MERSDSMKIFPHRLAQEDDENVQDLADIMKEMFTTNTRDYRYRIMGENDAPADHKVAREIGLDLEFATYNLGKIYRVKRDNLHLLNKDSMGTYYLPPPGRSLSLYEFDDLPDKNFVKTLKWFEAP